MANFELPLKHNKKEEQPTTDWSSFINILPLITGKSDPLLEAALPIIQNKKFDLQSLLPILPLLMQKKEPQKQHEPLTISINDYKRI